MRNRNFLKLVVKKVYEQKMAWLVNSCVAYINMFSPPIDFINKLDSEDKLCARLYRNGGRGVCAFQSSHIKF